MGVSLKEPQDGDLGEVSDINVTPFIDVILVLLIIFMVAAPLSTVDVAVDLPVSNAQPQQRPDTPMFLTVKGDLSLAEVYYRDAAETFRAKLGATHPRYAAALNGWACALRDLKRPADAEALYRQAIEVYEKNGRREGAVLAIPLYNLGMLQLEQGRIAEAGPLFEKAVQLAEKSRATNREAYLVIVRGLVRYYRASGQMDRATQAEQKAMDVLID